MKPYLKPDVKGTKLMQARLLWYIPGQTDEKCDEFSIFTPKIFILIEVFTFVHINT